MVYRAQKASEKFRSILQCGCSIYIIICGASVSMCVLNIVINLKTHGQYCCCCCF